MRCLAYKSLLHLFKISLQFAPVVGCFQEVLICRVCTSAERQLTSLCKNPHCVVMFVINRGHGVVWREEILGNV